MFVCSVRYTQSEGLPDRLSPTHMPHRSHAAAQGAHLHHTTPTPHAQLSTPGPPCPGTAATAGQLHLASRWCCTQAPLANPVLWYHKLLLLCCRPPPEETRRLRSLLQLPAGQKSRREGRS